MASRTARLPGLAVGEVEVGLPRVPVRRLDLPPALDRAAAVADRRRQARRARLRPAAPPPRGPVRPLALPPALDRVAVVADRRREALRERFALAPQFPPPVPDAHPVDAADAGAVGGGLGGGPVRQ